MISACAQPALQSAPPPAWQPPASVKQRLDAIETRIGGRLGVSALDTGSGHRFGHRAEERFANCSTFKWILAAAVLDSVAHGGLTLDQRVRYGPSDLLDYAPIARARVGEGSLKVEELCMAAVEQSDNTAANLLLVGVNGPAGLTSFVRAHGDSNTRFDRNEPSLNENLPGEVRDTTLPNNMVSTMQTLLLGDALSAASREKLIGWMVACETGRARLRAGLPTDWRVGDKTGTGERGSFNDLAIAFPPNRAAILIASYISGATASADICNAAHADVARLVAETFA